MSRAFALLLVMIAGSALAGQAFVPELRGGASVLSGREDVRIQYVGENDLYTWAVDAQGAREDRWYTAGNQLSVRWGVDPMALGLAPWPFARVLFSASLGQTIYTPHSTQLQTPEELEGDRPNAGWLAGSFGVDALTRVAPLTFVGRERGHSQLGLQLFAGALGPWSLAGRTQQSVHATMRELNASPAHYVQPLGWQHAQIAPSVSVDASAFGETSLIALRSSRNVRGSSASLYVLGAARGDAGYALVAGAANLTVLGGFTGDPVGPTEFESPFAAYLFARAEGRAVAWNASIDAGVDGAAPVARHAPWVGELSAGLVLRLGGIELAFNQIYRSNEVATLPAELRTGQWFGQLTVSLIL